MKFLSARIIGAIAWLVLSLSLSFWWAIMGIRYAEDIAHLQKVLRLQDDDKVVSDLHRKHRMIKMEGVFFLFLISGGGLTLIFMSIYDIRRNRIIKDFFATVTHEMRTPLASLRLQAETLSDSIKSPKHRKLLNRLVSDTERLELQMERALYLASLSRSESLYLETISCSEIFSNISQYYPSVKLSLPSNPTVSCDRRALESILKNLIENSLNHGEATEISIRSYTEQSFLVLEITDNGKGFSGNVKKLGQLYYRPTANSGSGIGLYLTSTLMKKMRGKAEFLNPDNRFIVRLYIPISLSTV